MPRTHGKTKCATWSDDDFLALSPAEKVLYMALYSHKGTSYAGVHDYRPTRLAKLIAPNATPVDARRVAQRLADKRYLVIDEETEEVFVRSFVRHDELYKAPKIMVASVSAFDEIHSPVIRRAYLIELRRLREEFPEANGWNDSRVTGLLRRPLPPTGGQDTDELASFDALDGLDATPARQQAAVVPEQGRKGTGNPSGKGFPKGSADPSGDSFFDPSGKGFPTTTSTTPTTTRAKALDAPGGAAAASDDPTSTPTPIDGGLFPAPADSGEKPDPESAQTVLAWWLDRCKVRPPKPTIGHVAKEVKSLLDEGIPAEHVYRGLARWMEKGLGHPSQIPNEVNAAMNGSEQSRFPLRAVSGGYSTGPTLYRNPSRDAYADNTL